MIEKWFPITKQVIPNIKPYYQISTYGNVYTSTSNKIMTLHQNIDTGYVFTGFRVNESRGYVNAYIHRLVLMTFGYITGCEILEVNHKDGNKSNNTVYNLEWMTRIENINHGFVNNLYKHGEEHHNSNFTNNQVKLICQGLEDGLSYKEIANNIGEEYSNKLSCVISDIRAGRYWIDISKNYNFKNKRSDQLFSDEDVNFICKCLEENISYENILSKLNLKEDDKYLKSINRIYKRIHYTKISNNYNF